MNIGLELRGEEVENAKLELLIQILAAQKATAATLIEMLAKSDEEADKFISLWSKGFETHTERILQSLYERRGHVNPSDVLPGK